MSKRISTHIFDTIHNRYKILSVLGKGGMGTVYLAEDLHLKGKKWAIKEIIIQEARYQNFIDEAKILISLEHPNLPKIIDYYSPDKDGLCYLVMDYINGLTLKEIFEQAGLTINHQRIIKYGLQLCDLFDYLHNRQTGPIIYRDLKPSNIMIDEFDNVRLIDFGTARNYKEGKQIDTIQLGTVGFAAPEQFEGKQTDQRSDIYSLGALMYYLLSNGKYYYLTQKPLNYFRNDLNVSLLNIINKMIKIDPKERYQNIYGVKQDLDGLILDYLDVTEKINVTTNNFTYNQEVISNISTISTKQILITNISKRAGSTFLAVNLAKYLSEFNILTCVIEIPFEPYLFDYIGLDKDDFYSFAHEIYEGRKIEKERETLYSNILWMITDPRKPKIDKNNWNYNQMMKLLYSSKKASISIIDAGEYIEHESIKPLIDEVDLILVIVDPMPSEVNLNLGKVRKFLRAKEEGLPVEFVLNNYTENINLNDLVEALGGTPITLIPNINLSFIHKAVNKCEIPFNFKEVKLLLEKPLNEITKMIIPINLKYRENEGNSRRKNILSKWLRR
ncbi:MAG: protein kinase [Vulcanibacillus sp.]